MSSIGSSSIEGTTEDTSIVPIPRMITEDHHAIRRLKKVFKIYTYGLATKAVQDSTITNAVFATTSLANIPWARLHWYLTQSEFETLPIDAAVTMCKCKIRMEAPRTAFEQNASTSHLATIHQNKFLRVGHGLLQKGVGVNKKYQFAGSAGSDPMIPTSVVSYTNADRKNQSEAMWGKPNVDLAGAQVIPNALFGIPFQLDEYFTVPIPVNSAEARGYPSLTSHIAEIPADGCVGQTIVDDYLYIPGNSGQHQNVTRIYRKGYYDEGGNHKADGYMVQQQEVYGQWADSIHNTQWPNPDESFAPLTQIIEQSQVVKRGLQPQTNARTQPSVHIGMTAIEALTTNAQLAPNVAATQYTDCQGMFIVETECEVATYFPTHRPFSGLNCKPSEQYWFDETQVLDTDSVMYGGLYRSKKTSKPTQADVGTINVPAGGGTFKVMVPPADATLKESTNSIMPGHVWMK